MEAEGAVFKFVHLLHALEWQPTDVLPRVTGHPNLACRYQAMQALNSKCHNGQLAQGQPLHQYTAVHPHIGYFNDAPKARRQRFKTTAQDLPDVHIGMSSHAGLPKPWSCHRSRPPAAARLVAIAASAAAGSGFNDGAYSLHKPDCGMAELWAAVKAFIEAQYLPIALLSALALGASYPSLGLAAAKMHIPAVATFGIFLVQVGV